jgi:hypothetical protein
MKKTEGRKSRDTVPLKYYENAFFIVGIVKERIFRVGSKTGSVTFNSQRGSRSESEKNSFGSTTLAKL